MRVTLSATGRVRCEASIDVGLPPQRLWAEIRDLARFATHDFFHAEFRSPDRTLSDEDARELREKIVAALGAQFGAELRA